MIDYWSKEGQKRLWRKIAKRYDLINRILSLGLDGKWRKFAISQINLSNRKVILDLCVGTGKLALEALRGNKFRSKIVGIDISEAMLKQAKRNASLDERLNLLLGNGLELPFRDEVFDVVMSSFALRNLGDIERTLGEINRVLKPGGQAVILDFGKPLDSWIGKIHRGYLRVFVPFVGGLISGDVKAYRYLSGSIINFVSSDSILNSIVQAGFCQVRYFSLFYGAANCYIGQKKSVKTEAIVSSA